MPKYIAQRLLLSVPVFLAVVTIVFLVVRVIPGDPATAALGDYASKEAVDALRERMGLNASLPVQYGRFLRDLVRGDLGMSMITGASIRDQIAHALPYTVELTAVSILIGCALGVPVGVYTAVRRNRLGDYVGRVLSLTGLSVPAFYFGILLILLLAIWLQWLPAVGGGASDDAVDRSRHLVLPALTLGLIMTASVARLARSAMLNVLAQDYVRTARAKGLRERAVRLRHALRSALVPIVSVTGIWAVSLIGDSVTVEVVFARPGLGKMMVGAILQRDYTALQSVMVVYTGFVVAINLATDLVYGWVDPRIRH
ncbi:MAG TPA: ABC transporter permease [Methylomirabilota bacterium]|jgi:ABC-type dipeptide/oligopeptide/nickel transport system permease component|nr:ABC transporter permease [Methylomirabilota bacterium]